VTLRQGVEEKVRDEGREDGDSNKIKPTDPSRLVKEAVKESVRRNRTKQSHSSSEGSSLFLPKRKGGKKESMNEELVHDPDTWTTPHLLHLKREYVTLVDKYGCVVEEIIFFVFLPQELCHPRPTHSLPVKMQLRH
jgi:hypothetical protein